ncbi:5,10-methylenetetrahydromethanopterin reductase [Halorubellus sp. PRR65]|uniref:5,10-methylenetetrahydromethanopterin reductase n=1 Tax=Halorubellus sp. PRR65 TaxID=3098148 RepID=UPI002B26375B|nr:5,10-methylenetetrahydromethanopterin reductase [Halorubellus sp. PRR65]
MTSDRDAVASGDVRFGVEVTPEHPVEDLVGFAQTAEEVGFDAVFASSHYNNRDPFVALSRMAGATERVRLGPGVVNPYETHPVTQASRVATLAEASDGRALYGLGAGDGSTLANLGVDQDRPLRRVLESFKVAQDLFDGERVDHDGTFVASGAKLNYEPPGEVPVFVGAQGPHMTRMAAKHADGVLYNGSHPRDVAWAAERVAEGREDRPDEYGDVSFLAYASVSIAEDETAARDAARIPVAFIVGGAPPPVLDRHGIDGERAASVGDAVSAGEFRDAGAAVTDAMLDAFCIAGTPADVSERFDAILDHADGIVAAAPLGPDVDAAVELTAEALDRVR